MQKDVAAELSIAPNVISRYETGERTPDPATLARFAEFYGVTTDYLTGQSDTPRPVTINDLIEKEERGIPFSAEEEQMVRRMGEAFKNATSELTQSITDSVKKMADVKFKLPFTYRVPILGTIRAGLPILAEDNIDGYLDVPENIRADFVLRVQGDSMIGAGILDGDYAICKEAQIAISGQITVALRDLSTGTSEATLKYFFDNGNGPVLRAANPSYEDIAMTEGCRIAGVMVGLVREGAAGYHIYKNFLAANDSEDWTEVIELATSAGLKANQIKEIIAAQIDLAKRLKGDK